MCDSVVPLHTWKCLDRHDLWIKWLFKDRQFDEIWVFFSFLETVLRIETGHLQPWFFERLIDKHYCNWHLYCIFLNFRIFISFSLISHTPLSVFMKGFNFAVEDLTSSLPSCWRQGGIVNHNWVCVSITVFCL